MRELGQKILGALLLAALAVAPKAWAQAPVITQPGMANSGDASGTIASSSLFQRIWSATSGVNGSSSPGRAGCLVLNNAANRQWVYFQGPGMAAPTSGTFSVVKLLSVPLEAAPAATGAGGFVSCATGAGQVLQDAVWIAGTVGDTYVAKQQ